MALSMNVQESKAACCNYDYHECKMYRSSCASLSHWKCSIKQYFSDGSLYKNGKSACCANGIGGCNIFCCNCDKGCHYTKWGPRKKRSAMRENVAKKIMKEADLSGDGNLDVIEAYDFLVAHGKIEEDSRVKRDAELPQWFKAIDYNQDGLIQPIELDHDIY